MHALLEELGRSGADALRAAFGPDGIPEVLSIEPSTRADLQTAAAMGLARALKKPPRDIAQKVLDALATHPAVARAELAGAGFVNLTLRDAWLAEHLPDALETPKLGRGATVVIDYSSPNVAKPMHIGHIRSTILGEALKRVLRATGYTVVADNHLGDWGTQFGKLIVAYRRWLVPENYRENPVGELLRLYVKYTEVESEQRGAAAKPAGDGDEGDDEPVTGDAPEILQAARAELVKLQRGDPENLALWKDFVDVSMKEFDRVYRRLGVSFDVTLGESFYNDMLAETVDELLAKGIAEPSRGAVIVQFDKARDGEAMPPFLVRKADGGFLYGTTDIAAVRYRVKEWSPARVVYVTDERQQLHFRQLFATARRMGVEARLEHVWFGLMRMAEGTIKTRAGNVIGLESLLDEAEERAREVARGANASLSEGELAEVARVVGIGAVKYNDLSKDRQTLVTFTWDKALALNGNTAPYLQYAYARVRSILRKAAEQGAAPGPVGALEPAERALILSLLRLPLAVRDVAESCRPHLLCDQLYQVATAFSTFYNECPVLKAEPEVRASRLTLTATVAEALKAGLDLLGIEVIERM
ncbi:MAG: arginine--tRNA ligase [Polyangiales bacterium]